MVFYILSRLLRWTDEPSPLSNATTGVIFKIEPNLFRVLDQNGTVRSLSPSQIGIKSDSRRAIAMDAEGIEIKEGEMMKESGVSCYRLLLYHRLHSS